MSQGARNWPFFTLMARPVAPGGQQQVGLAAEEGGDLQHVHRLGRRGALLGGVHVGERGQAGARAHLGEDRRGPRAMPMPRAAVALVRLALSKLDL